MAKAYRVAGSFRMGDEWVPFANEVNSDTPDKARERILSEFGSRHHIGRRYIKVDTVDEVKAGAERAR